MLPNGTDASNRSTRRLYLGRVAVMLAALVAYANAIPNEFVWDDLTQVEHNPFIREPANALRAFQLSYWAASSASPGAAPGHYRPLTTASYVLSWATTGDSPAGFRIVNLAFHAANALLVTLLALELGIGAPWTLVAGLVFALHPVNSEAVDWVVGRAELAATFGSLLCLWLLIRFPGRRRPAILAAGALLVGLLFKESAASAVLIVTAWEFARSEGRLAQRTRAGLRAAIPAMVAVLAYLAIRTAAIGVAHYDERFFVGVAGWQVALTMTRIVLQYGWLLVAPFNLRAHYDLVDFPVPNSLMDLAALTSLAIVVSVIGAIAWGLYRRESTAIAAAWMVAGLAPYLHIVPFRWLMAERFLYASTVGYGLLVALGADALRARLAPHISSVRLATMCAIAIAVVFVPRVVTRNAVWADEITFFSKMTEQEPDLVGARVALSDAPNRPGRFPDAMREIEMAYRLGWKPDLLPDASP